MKEIIKAIKKNFVDLIIFFVCVFVGAWGAYGVGFLYTENFNKEFTSLTECSALVSSVANFRLKNSELTAGYQSTTYSVYNINYNAGYYPTELNCEFSDAEKAIGIDKIYNQYKDKLSQVTDLSNKAFRISNYRDDLGFQVGGTEFDFDLYKARLIDLMGEDDVIEAEGYNDLLFISYTEYLGLIDQNDILYQELKDAFVTEDFIKKINKLEQDTSRHNLLVNTQNSISAILVCIVLALVLYLLSRYSKRFKDYIGYIIIGIILFIAFAVLFEVLNYISWS